MSENSEVYPMVLPEEYVNGFGVRVNTAQAWHGAEVYDHVWVELRRRVVQKVLKELDLLGIIELPPDAPEWVAVREYGAERVLALVSVREFMR